MRTPCCLLSVSALLVGALAIGNPFLPPRQSGSSPKPASAERREAAPLARRDARSIAPFAVRAVWQDPRVSPRRSPLWTLQQKRLVLPRDADVPIAVPASYTAPVVGSDDGSRPPQ